MRARTRKALSRRAKAEWARLSDAERVARLARSAEATRARYPYRQPLHDAVMAKVATGDIQSEACPDCGGEGRIELQFDDAAETVKVVGWRCYSCRRKSVRSIDQMSTVSTIDRGLSVRA